MKFIIKIAIYALAILVCSYFLPGVHVQSFLDFLLLAVVLIVLKTVLKPILVLLTLPINMLTLGLFTLVINTVIMLLADALIVGVIIDNFWWAFLFSLILSVLVGVFESFDKKLK
ncbi:MAG TPA: phage holin family protein [Candidatus Dojkabacteria bacterium]|nr:phage holin family protein [Candidatus Dojkabacteria bacterium]